MIYYYKHNYRGCTHFYGSKRVNRLRRYVRYHLFFPVNLSKHCFEVICPCFDSNSHAQGLQESAMLRSGAKLH